LPSTTHGFFTLSLFVFATLIAVDHEATNTRSVTRHLLHARAGRRCLLLSIDPSGAIDPSILLNPVNQLLHLRVAPANHTQEITARHLQSLQLSRRFGGCDPGSAGYARFRPFALRLFASSRLRGILLVAARLRCLHSQSGILFTTTSLHGLHRHRPSRFRSCRFAPEHPKVLLADHAAVANEHHPAEMKTLRQIQQYFWNGGHIARVAGPHVMRDRPTRHHHHAHHHLHVSRLAVATVSVPRHRRTMTLEVRARQVVEHQLGLDVEQVS